MRVGGTRATSRAEMLRCPAFRAPLRPSTRSRSPHVERQPQQAAASVWSGGDRGGEPRPNDGMCEQSDVSLAAARKGAPQPRGSQRCARKGRKGEKARGRERTRGREGERERRRRKKQGRTGSGPDHLVSFAVFPLRLPLALRPSAAALPLLQRSLAHLPVRLCARGCEARGRGPAGKEERALLLGVVRVHATLVVVSPLLPFPFLSPSLPLRLGPLQAARLVSYSLRRRAAELTCPLLPFR